MNIHHVSLSHSCL